MNLKCTAREVPLRSLLFSGKQTCGNCWLSRTPLINVFFIEIFTDHTTCAS